MARLLFILLLLLGFSGTAREQSSVVPTNQAINLTAFSFSAQEVSKQSAATYKAPSSIKKKKGLKVRYMKAEIRYTLSDFFSFVKRPFFVEKEVHFFYSVHLTPDHHQQYKLRGPPAAFL